MKKLLLITIIAALFGCTDKPEENETSERYYLMYESVYIKGSYPDTLPDNIAIGYYPNGTVYGYIGGSENVIVDSGSYGYFSGMNCTVKGEIKANN